MKFDRNYTLAEIAAMMQAGYEGDPDFVISGINEIHMVQPGDITFVDHPKYYDKALQSKATTIIINKQVPCPAGKTLIFHDAPFDAYNQLVKEFIQVEQAHQAISSKARIGLIP